MENKKHKQGDVGEDGKVFWSYAVSCKNGEQWVTQDNYTRKVGLRDKWLAKRKAESESKVKKHKRGDARDDGMVFWVYTPAARNGEFWISQEKFAKKISSRKDRLARKKEMFENHPKPLKKGDIREDGKVFMKYFIDAKDFEWWVEADYIDYSSKQWKYFRRKYRECPMNRMKDQVRHRIFLAFQRSGYSKNTETEKMIGCSFDYLENHLEKQFEDGMSWDNMGEWHIDHRLPLAAAKNKGELLKLSHYSNLQPMWAKENISKGDKHDPEELKAYLAA